jgi:hypothetical protein
MPIIVHPKYPDLVGVRSVELLTDFRVQVTFTDGVEREINLERHLYGPIFEPLRHDPKLFAAIFVDPIGQTLAWPNGADIAPETLYYAGDPPWATDDQPRPRRTRRPASSQPRARHTRRKTPARAKVE